MSFPRISRAEVLAISNGVADDYKVVNYCANKDWKGLDGFQVGDSVFRCAKLCDEWNATQKIQCPVAIVLVTNPKTREQKLYGFVGRQHEEPASHLGLDEALKAVNVPASFRLFFKPIA